MSDPINRRIQDFYDQSTPLWLDVWGEHMHHGHYGPAGDQVKEDRQAQLDLMLELLAWGGPVRAERILDAGCGVGGSARFLARELDAEVVGLTLSPVQAERARAYNRAAGLEGQVRIEVQDMMTLDAEAGSFDLIWSMESAEHIRDKARLFRLFYERLRPGGRLLMATWCHRPVPPSLTASESALLQRIYQWYHLPPMIATDALKGLAEEAGFEGVRTADWSRAVAPFWKAVIRSALQWRSLIGLWQAGWATLRGAWAMQYMQRGFRKGLIQFAVLKAQKAREGMAGTEASTTT